jgi:hypothetical protein
MYKFNECRHYRDIRKVDDIWQWCLYSAISGRLLKVLLSDQSLQSLQIQVKGWLLSEKG